jgi:putative Mg2+ transporter-C (MgtC) family protein
MQLAILKVLDAAGQRLAIQDRDNIAGIERIAFTITTTSRVHKRLLNELRASDATDQVVMFRDTEDE